MVPFVAFKCQRPKDQPIQRMKNNSFSPNIQELLQREKHSSSMNIKFIFIVAFGKQRLTIFKETKREGLINRNKQRKGID